MHLSKSMPGCSKSEVTIRTTTTQPPGFTPELPQTEVLADAAGENPAYCVFIYWMTTRPRLPTPHLPKTTALESSMESHMYFLSMLCMKTCRTQNPDIPRADRGGAAHGGAAARCGVGRDADGTVRPEDNRPFLPSGASQIAVLNDPSEARTNKTLCKPMGEQNPRLTRGR